VISFLVIYLLIWAVAKDQPPQDDRTMSELQTDLLRARLAQEAHQRAIRQNYRPT
jgi:hypothetical protein